MANFTFLKAAVQADAAKLFIMLNGAELNNFEKFHKKIALLLHFPDYYGNNLDALDEVLTDMAFSSLKNISIVFSNYDKLLCDEPHEKKIALLQVLNAAVTFWKQDGSRQMGVLFEPSKTAKADVKAIPV